MGQARAQPGSATLPERFPDAVCCVLPRLGRGVGGPCCGSPTSCQALTALAAARQCALLTGEALLTVTAGCLWVHGCRPRRPVLSIRVIPLRSPSLA